MMINIVFRPRIGKRDTEVDTTTPLVVEEEPYVDPICSVGHYIECAFNFSNCKEAYLFIADRCLHINYAPNDKIINGPLSIGYGFPYLRDTIFASGIDAAFTSS
ncbi:albumin-2 protein [Cinnamomum micranthum f. kanehirae]|uniref:Albumin-2 protein n=1 Tax=Cinnamomum micranthum f. kanehirae TaxID=337451 RepID=A0A3S3NUB4_9MAGN|nr:albumin-2 protein [Cinnamomum micranthum f. kanehirae]